MSDKTFPDTDFCLVKLRVDYNTISEYADRLQLITSFIDNLDIKDKTAGIHHETKKHGKHFHVHLVLNGDYKDCVPFKNGSYYFKKHLAKNGYKDKFGYSIGKVEALYIDDLQPDIGTALSKFLRYTLKDKMPIPTLCSFTQDELETMSDTAYEENRFAKEQILKAEALQIRKETKWNEIRDYLDESLGKDKTPSELFQLVAKKLKTDTIPPTTKQILTMVERYTYYTGDPYRIFEIAESTTKHLRNTVEKLSP
jgi:hypothetical protein